MFTRRPSCNAPPSIQFRRTDLSEGVLFRNFPNQSSPTAVWCNDERVSIVARFDFKICDFPKRESVDSNVGQDLETMVDGSTCGSMKAGSVLEALAAVLSTASGRPTGDLTFFFSSLIGSIVARRLRSG
jgi:hypothetical protein